MHQAVGSTSNVLCYCAKQNTWVGLVLLRAVHNKQASVQLTLEACRQLPFLIPCCVQALSRRLHSAPQKLVATSADIQAVQSAACACLAAAFGTKSAYPPVETLLHAQATTSLISTLLNLSLTGNPLYCKYWSSSL